MAEAWTWGPTGVAAHVAARLGVEVAGAPVRLTGGLLNVVWRVPAAGGSVVVKVVPPFAAAAPDVALSPARGLAEARALIDLPPRLAAAGPEGTVALPRLLDLDADRSVLVMTDAGDVPHLGTWLATASPADAADALARMGAFVGRLHGATRAAPDLGAWHQPDVAAVRRDVQYRTVAARLDGAPDAAALGAVAVDLGTRWLAPGRCVVMGDLWPPSVLVGAGGALTVIDWELCTAGEPAQDLGHLAAHLWRMRRLDLWEPFVAGYRTGAGGALGTLLAGGTAADAARHAACEVLARVAGPFAGGGVEAGEAVRTAAAWLRGPAASPVAMALSA